MKITIPKRRCRDVTCNVSTYGQLTGHDITHMLQGIIREGLTIHSQILAKPTHYTIYLPYDYETSTRFYPVIYMLHGSRADDTSWVH